jgi:hypothetical protein
LRFGGAPGESLYLCLVLGKIKEGELYLLLKKK